MALQVGSRLGHYDVTALIGEGGMGQVYQATDTKLRPEQRLALAVIARAIQDLSSSESLTRSVQELHQNAAEFLNGSDGFYFWTQVLEQNPEWLRRRLHTQLLSRPRTELRRNVRLFPHR